MGELPGLAQLWGGVTLTPPRTRGRQQVGFNISALHDAGAAFTHQGHILDNLAKGLHAPLPRFVPGGDACLREREG